jgi:hypothetical protein
MPKSNVIEPVSPYATDVFRADYLAAAGPHPYLAAVRCGRERSTLCGLPWLRPCRRCDRRSDRASTVKLHKNPTGRVCFVRRARAIPKRSLAAMRVSMPMAQFVTWVGVALVVGLVLGLALAAASFRFPRRGDTLPTTP